MSEQRTGQNANAAPALNLLFDGLFFLCFNKGGKPADKDPADECRVGFLTTAPQHRITITGRRVGARQPDFEFALSHAQIRGLQLALDIPGVKSPSVTRKGHDQTFDRMSEDTEPIKDYFKWIIDLENKEMHDKPLKLIDNVLKPVLSIKIGEFYTQELSKVKYFRTKIDEPDEDFGSVAAVTGVRISMLPEGKAFLKLGSASFPLVAPKDQTYEVKFQNRCPQCDEQNLGNLHLSDFPLHYHAFDVKVLEQFDFDYPGNPPSTPPAICYAASGSQTTDI